MPAQRVPRTKGQSRTRPTQPSPESGPATAFRISRLELHNVRRIRELVLDFPPPVLVDDPDVHVIGSANGVGKTTVLEAIALLFMQGGEWGPTAVDVPRWYEREDVRDLVPAVVRHGERLARVEATMSGPPERCTSWTAQRDPVENPSRALFGTAPMPGFVPRPAAVLVRAMQRLLGQSPEPFVAPGCIYLHSYRQVRSSGVGLASALAPDGQSLFKDLVVRALLSRSGLVEGSPDAQDDDEVPKVLDRLSRTYAGGTVGSLTVGHDGTYDLRVSRPDGTSFSFNALSSGQKEIISTLFLIWLHTRNQPSIVLIDEPELHLNAEWQCGLVHTLHDLAPANQYILATHSEDIWGSVLPERRILLEPDEGE